MSGVLSKVKRGIFVLDHHGFGNVVLSLPLLQSISRWALNKCVVRVLFRSPEHFRLIQSDVSGIEPIYLQAGYNGLRGLCKLRMDFGGTADMLIAVPGVPVSTAIAVKLALGADLMVGEALRSRQWLFSVWAEKGWDKSILQSQQELARSLGLHMNVLHPVLSLSEAEETWAEQTLRHTFKELPAPIVGVQCGAKEISKQWPVDSFGQVLALLKARFPDLGVISFGSKDERAKTAAARVLGGAIPWLDGVGQWNIRESLAMLKKCDLLLSGDTGVMHMAASLRVSTVSIFGPTSPERLAPFHTGGICVRPAASCHPCFRDEWTSCHCIALIQPEEIASLLTQCLGQSELHRRGSGRKHSGLLDSSQCVGDRADTSCDT